MIETDDAEFAPIGNRGSVILLRSDKDAPNRKVIAVDLQNPAPSAWKTIVPEQPQAIESVGVIGGRVVAQYLVDVQSRLRLFGLDGTDQGEIALPGIGTVGGLSGREDTPGVWYTFTSPLAPSTVFRYDPATKTSTPFEPPPLPIDVSGFETKAMFATSKDGTKVPFFLTAKKGLPLDGNNPTMIYGYGGFSVSTLPTYRQDVPAWLEMGGVWVTASMRGGAEYGEAWHKAGMLEKKQNVFDDFIAVAEHLVREKYTSPAKLGVMGGSNGGLLVGAVINQRPDLYAVALPAVGVMDMLRYDRFTGGRLWVQEYGSAQNPGAVPVPHQVLTGAEREEGHLLSGHARDDRRPRRPRRAEPLVQVRGGDAGGAGMREPDADPRRGLRLARLSPDRQADRRARRSVGVRGAGDGNTLSKAQCSRRSAQCSMGASLALSLGHCELIRHEPLQLLDPVLHDDDARRRGGPVGAALLDHQEPLAVG